MAESHKHDSPELIEEFKTKLRAHSEELSNPELFYEDAQTPDDHTISRYLRARKGHVQDAIKQYIEAQKWFKSKNWHLLPGDDPNEKIYLSLSPFLNAGHDKEGRPIHWERTGTYDMPKMFKLLTIEDLVQRHVREQKVAFLRMKELSEQFGKNIEQQVVIMDLKGLSLAPNSAALSTFRQCSHIDQAYFPETLAHCFLINAPWIFQPVWAIVKPWLDPVTRAKFHVLGHNYQEQLFKYIDPSQLPKEYGGTADWAMDMPTPYHPAEAEASSGEQNS